MKSERDFIYDFSSNRHDKQGCTQATNSRGDRGGVKRAHLDVAY
jgi:hypothetical protein